MKRAIRSLYSNELFDLEEGSDLLNENLYVRNNIVLNLQTW